MTETIKQVIELYEKELSGNDLVYNITKVIPMKDGATLYLFENEEWEIRSSAIGYDDGSVFVMRDWQGERPTSAEEVKEYPNDWIGVNGHCAIMLNGLPRFM